MKKILLIFLVVPAAILAQDSFGSIKLGVFNPSAAGAGFIIGYEGGWEFDRNLKVGWDVDWFHKSYVDQNLVTQFNNFYGVNSSLNELRASTNLHAIPLMASTTLSFPASFRTKVYINGAIGLEMLLIYYHDYNNPDNSEFRGAFDFAWQLGAGVAYELGPRSDLILEAAYHYSQPSWDYNATDPRTGRTQTFQQVFDMSGLMLRTGIRFYF